MTAPDKKTKKPILCRMRLHDWYVDGAMFTVAMCCNRCGKYQDEQERLELERERSCWDGIDHSLSFGESMAAVRRMMHDS